MLYSINQLQSLLVLRAKFAVYLETRCKVDKGLGKERDGLLVTGALSAHQLREGCIIQPLHLYNPLQTRIKIAMQLQQLRTVADDGT